MRKVFSLFVVGLVGIVPQLARAESPESSADLAKRIEAQAHSCRVNPQGPQTRCWDKPGNLLAEFPQSLETIGLRPEVVARLETAYRTTCILRETPQQAGRENPFLQHGLVVPAGAVCRNVDGRIRFWQQGGSQFSIEHERQSGNWLNARWKLQIAPPNPQLISVGDWPMLRCAAFQSEPVPTKGGGPRQQAVWNLTSQIRPEAQVIEVWYAHPPTAKPPKQGKRSFLRDISRGTCRKELSEER
jgi:hypothetical protein